jgi:hypothetical protein
VSTVTGISNNDLRRIATYGDESERMRIMQHDLPYDVLEILVNSKRPMIAIALVSAQHDLPRDLVDKLEEHERIRLRQGNSIGLDQLIGNMDHASNEFRLRMLLEDIKFERLRDVFDELNLPDEQREEISARKRSGEYNETVAQAITATTVR